MTGLLVLVEGESDAEVVRVLAAAGRIGEVPLLPTGGAMGAARALRGLASRPGSCWRSATSGRRPMSPGR